MKVEYDYITGAVVLSENESWIQARDSEVFKWVNINGVKPNTYIISSNGKLYQTKLKMEVKMDIRNGYKTSLLVDESGNNKEYRVDELVARSFIKDYDVIRSDHPELKLRHMNGITTYNGIENLELLL